MLDDVVAVVAAHAATVNVVIILFITFIRAIAVAIVVCRHRHRRLRGRLRLRRHYGRIHRLVMLDPVANQSRTVLCTELGIHNVDAPF